MKKYCTIEINPGNLPFARIISEVEFKSLTETDQALFGDSIIYFDEEMYLHISFKNVRHMQPLSEEKRDYYKRIIMDSK